MKEKIITIIDIIVLILLAPILFVSVVILTDLCLHPDEIPSFFGYKPFIMTTNSMVPLFGFGDVVLTKESDYTNLKIGDIIAYKKDDKVTIHRIQNIESDEKGIKKYHMKGDRSLSEDTSSVLENEIEGIYFKTYKKIGEILLFIQSPLGIILSLSIPIIMLIYVYTEEYQEILFRVNENNEEQANEVKEDIKVKEKIKNGKH